MIAFRGQRATAADGFDLTALFPVGWEPGMFALLAITGGVGGITTTPVGWTPAPKLAALHSSGGGESGLIILRTYFYYRTLDVTDAATTAAGSVSVTFDSAVSGVASIMLFTGVDPLNPIDAAIVDTTLSSTTLQGRGIAFTVDGAMLVATYALNIATAVTPPAQMQKVLEAYTNSSSATLSVAIEATSGVPSSYGNRDATVGAPYSGMAILYMLAPAATPAVAAAVDERDLYRSVILRGHLKRFRNDRESNIAKLTAAFGAEDNVIGGLSQDRNFLDTTAAATSYARIRRVGVSTINAGGLTAAPAIPAGVQDGDRLIAFIVRRNQTNVTVPSSAGWSAVTSANYTNGADRWVYAILTKTAAAEGATVTFSLGAVSTDAIVHLVAYRNVGSIGGAIFSVGQFTTQIVFNTPPITATTTPAQIELTHIGGQIETTLVQPRGSDVRALTDFPGAPFGPLHAETYETTFDNVATTVDVAPHYDLLSGSYGPPVAAGGAYVMAASIALQPAVLA